MCKTKVTRDVKHYQLLQYIEGVTVKDPEETKETKINLNWN